MLRNYVQPHEPWSIWKRGFPPIFKLTTGKSKMLDPWALVEGKIAQCMQYYLGCRLLKRSFDDFFDVFFVDFVIFDKSEMIA